MEWPRRSTAARVLLAAVAGPVLASYAITVALVALLSTTANAPWSLAGTLRASAPFWLAVHQVPLMITSAGGVVAPLGVLPLLPTIGLAVLVACSAGNAAARLGWQTPGQLAALVATFGGVHGVLGASVAVLQPSPRMAAAPVHALFCAFVAGLAAAIGGVRAARLAALASPLLPAWVVPGVRAGLVGLAALLTGGVLCTLGGLLLSAGAVHDVLIGWAGAPGGRLGVTVLSIAYLPNAAVAALSWTTGPGLSVGAVSVTAFGTTAGALPAVPLFAALPDSGPAPSRILVFVLPALAGVLVGRCCRRTCGDLTDRLHSVVTAGAVAAASCSVLAILAGGRLGGGAFDPVRIPAASVAVAVFAWLVLPAGMIVGLTDRSSRSSGILDDASADADAPVPSDGNPLPDVEDDLSSDVEADVLSDAAVGLLSDVGDDVLSDVDADVLTGVDAGLLSDVEDDLLSDMGDGRHVEDGAAPYGDAGSGSGAATETDAVDGLESVPAVGSEREPGRPRSALGRIWAVIIGSGRSGRGGT